MARIHIDGMTCNKCVNFIQSKVSYVRQYLLPASPVIKIKRQMREKPGVTDITVSLEEKEAQVTYAPEVLTCHQVAEAITGVAEKFTGCVISDS